MQDKFKNHFVVGLLLFTILGIVVVVWATSKNYNTDRIRIENKTRSLLVESVKESIKSNRVEVSFRNNYEKPIAAYRVRVTEEFNGKTDESAVERGGLIVGWVLRPNEIKVEEFPVNPKSKTNLTIAAVIFEDGTGDGEINELTILQEVRVGVRMGFQKIFPILQDAMKTKESFSSDSAIQSLEKKIKQLNDEDVPDNSKRGFALAKGYMSIELRDIRDKKTRNTNLNIETETLTKLTEVESALTKLSINPPSNANKERRQNEN